MRAVPGGSRGAPRTVTGHAQRVDPLAGPLRIDDILAMQHDAGNRSTAALIAQRLTGSGVRTMRQGTEGVDVRDLQSQLNALDEVKLPLTVDSHFGPLTASAVRQFQGEHPPLVVDATVGPLTRAALDQEGEEPQDDVGLARKVFLRGQTAFGANDFAHAFDFFTRAGELTPRPVVTFNRAQSLRRLGGRREEASALFGQYLTESPDGNRAGAAADAIAELKGPGKSGDDEVDIKTARGLFQKGAALFAANQFSHAFDAFSQADEVSHRPSITFAQAQSLRRLGGRREEAIVLYEQYLTESPNGEREGEARFFQKELRTQGAAP